MRLKNKSLFEPHLSFGIKKQLLNLNYDLDSICIKIRTNRDYGFWFDHSIFQTDRRLTKIEECILFLEDRRFFIHSGVEFRAIARGLRRLITRGKIGGISTIEQQAVRIALNRYERTISRKTKEILLGFLLNLHCSKREIFDYYIHNAYLGYGMQGCEVAANKIFGQNAASLNLHQAAFVSSLLPLPFPKDVWDNYRKLKGYPIQDPAKILELAEFYNARWAVRMKFRMSFALKSYPFSLRSL